MNVLVTGAGGNLGRVLVPALEAIGHHVRVFDFRAVDLGAESVVGDVRDHDDVARAVAGVDAIVHAAALHGIHLDSHAPEEYWSTNVTGTFNVYEAARLAGVRRIVLCSTMAVYGESAERTAGAWAVVTEDLPPRPKDVYGLSKLLCEVLAQHYAVAHGMVTVALRLGMFVPETFERYGFRLLFGGVDDREVADAVVRALAHDPDRGFDAFDVMADTPFDASDARALATDPAAAIERYWPGTAALVEQLDLDLGELVWGWAVWPVEKAKRTLGYAPRFDFAAFLDALRRGDREHYPFAGLPQWGVGA